MIDATDAVLGMLRWVEVLAEFKRDMVEIAHSARVYFLKPALDVVARKRVFDLISTVEDSLPFFEPLGWKCVELQQTKIQACQAACAALGVYADQVASVKTFCEAIVGLRSKWEAFSVALVENGLHDWRDWRQHPRPFLWLKKVTSDIANKQALDYTEDQETISLEEIAEVPGQALMERRYTVKSVAELQQAAENDPEMREYISAKIRFPKFARTDIWRELGWDLRRGGRVDRRYLRLRKQLRDEGIGMEWRSSPSLSGDASWASFFEVLYNGAKGRKAGAWTLRTDMEAPDSPAIAPFRPDPFPWRGFRAYPGQTANFNKTKQK